MKKMIISAFLLCFAIFANAQQNIAVVDMDKVFNDYHKKKIADAELKKQAELYKKYADELNASLLKLQEEFRTLRDDSLNIALSDVERENKRLAAQDKYRQMKEKEAELKNYSTDKQNQIKDRYEEVREKLVAEIKAVVSKIAAARGYMLVIDSSGKTLNQISSVVYHSADIDLTDEVLSELNPPEKSQIKSQPEEQEENQ